MKAHNSERGTRNEYSYRRILGVVGLLLAGVLGYVDRDVWKFNICATEGWATVEAVTPTSIDFRFNEEIVTRIENRRPTDYFKAGDEALIAYCKEDGGLMVYNYHEWSSNVLIMYRIVCIVVLSATLFINF